ncbi:FecR family protein [Calycomorphotria hydatis]|uniref:FecR protein n=1 Tax=Calycomorphotria hydatis TaxID=2528027 RepID=A0A517TAV4_9PLAN|nr:FecR family protein [Calycomorphotria hydatis]QDT65505.1 FecR protein [Calycomorphotria hydatis]
MTTPTTPGSNSGEGPLQRQQLISLAERVCTDSLDALGFTQLEQLLRQDLRYRQWYAEYLDQHSQLTVISQKETAAGMVEAIFMPKAKRRFTGKHVAAWAAGTTLSLVTCAALAFVIFWTPPAKVVGRVAILSEDAKFESTVDRPWVPGRLLNQMEQFTLQSGWAALEFESGTQITISAPTTIRLSSSEKTTLLEGNLAATVPPQAIGYRVFTSDAEIVDLGTEFLVERSSESGTQVFVQKGKVRTTLIDQNGDHAWSMELSEGRAARLDSHLNLGEEIRLPEFNLEQYSQTRQFTSGLRRLDGVIRSAAEPLLELTTGIHETHDHVLIIPEQKGVQFNEDITFQQYDRQITIPAGTVVDSYLLHFDAGKYSLTPPIGSATFNGSILGVVTDQQDLLKLDNLVGNPSANYPPDDFRGLESGDDQFEISPDRKTISVHLDMSPPVYFDQCRILVESSLVTPQNNNNSPQQ